VIGASERALLPGDGIEFMGSLMRFGQSDSGLLVWRDPPCLACGHFIGSLLQARLERAGAIDGFVAFRQEVQFTGCQIDWLPRRGSLMGLPTRTCKVFEALIHQLFRLRRRSQAGTMAPTKAPGSESH